MKKESLQSMFIFCPYVPVYLQEVRLTSFYICPPPSTSPVLSFYISLTKFPHDTYLFMLLPLTLLCLVSLHIFPQFILLFPSVHPIAALLNPIQPQVEPALEGEEVHATKAGGEGEEAFTEEYVTGDMGLKEYDYSYRDYNEPLVETGDANMGPALSAVTDEGGVSRFAKQNKKTQNHFQPTLKLSQVFSRKSHLSVLSLKCHRKKNVFLCVLFNVMQK